MPQSEGIHLFDHALQTANVWLKEAADELHSENPREAYQALRAVLHALRDRLTTSEAIRLGRQLPLLVAGVYYDGFRFREKPVRRDLGEFLGAIQERLQPAVPKPDPERCLFAVLKVLMRHVSEGELQDVRGLLPPDLQTIWARIRQEELAEAAGVHR